MIDVFAKHVVWKFLVGVRITIHGPFTITPNTLLPSNPLHSKNKKVPLYSSSMQTPKDTKDLYRNSRNVSFFSFVFNHSFTTFVFSRFKQIPLKWKYCCETWWVGKEEFHSLAVVSTLLRTPSFCWYHWYSTCGQEWWNRPIENFIYSIVNDRKRITNLIWSGN